MGRGWFGPSTERVWDASEFTMESNCPGANHAKVAEVVRLTKCHILTLQALLYYML